MAKSIKSVLEQTGDSKIKKDPYEALAKQVKAEYELAWKHEKPKKDEAQVRLKLYNNQKRDKKAVGDTTMFTIHQTVLASLYVDRLDSQWIGKNEGDDEVAENLNSLAENDYVDMEKEIFDYDWIWDTCFFGRGFLSMEEYLRDPDQNLYLPLPYVIDPILLLHDPFATSVNGNRSGRGQARFLGWEEKMTKRDMEAHPHIFEEAISSDLVHTSTTQSLLQDAKEARTEAQGLQSVKLKENEKNLGVNAQYDITKWYTHYEHKGKVQKVKVWLANERSKVIGLEILKGEKNKPSRWNIIDRPLYPHSHDWYGTSIPDLTEDKQRARAVAQNLGLNAMKADLYPMYIYDSNKITNKKDLNFDFNKFIPADGANEGIANAIMPLVKARPNMGLLDFIYTSLDASAQKATATPELQQGAMSSQERTLGELNLISSKVDTRYSLSAKVFGWSERKFWRRWYQMYKENFKEDIDEKVLRIEGAFGAKWRPLNRENIIAEVDPDVKIESRVLSRARQLEERQMAIQYFTLVLQDPTSNRRYILKRMGKLSGYRKDEIERMLPPTVDERIAEEQNILLNENKLAPVLPEDDHNVHLEIHSRANDTQAAKVHIRTHVEALSYKKTRPELFPEDTGEVNQFQPPTSGEQMNVPNAVSQKQNPIAPSQTSDQGIPQPQ